MQDCIETSAKSDVVTVCSWQSAGEERLQSMATILIKRRFLLLLDRGQVQLSMRLAEHESEGHKEELIA
jgi:hypothetical protein